MVLSSPLANEESQEKNKRMLRTQYSIFSYCVDANHSNFIEHKSTTYKFQLQQKKLSRVMLSDNFHQISEQDMANQTVVRSASFSSSWIPTKPIFLQCFNVISHEGKFVAS